MGHFCAAGRGGLSSTQTIEFIPMRGQVQENEEPDRGRCAKLGAPDSQIAEYCVVFRLSCR